MQQQLLKNSAKTLILFLAVFYMGGSWSYAGSIPEIKDTPLHEQNLQSAPLGQWIFIENNFHEFLELHHQFPSGSLYATAVLFSGIPSFSIVGYSKIYRRDLRRDISKQLFPKHFFL